MPLGDFPVAGAEECVRCTVTAGKVVSSLGPVWRAPVGACDRKDHGCDDHRDRSDHDELRPWPVPSGRLAPRTAWDLSGPSRIAFEGAVVLVGSQCLLTGTRIGRRIPSLVPGR